MGRVQRDTCRTFHGDCAARLGLEEMEPAALLVEGRGSQDPNTISGEDLEDREGRVGLLFRSCTITQGEGVGDGAHEVDGVRVRLEVSRRQGLVQRALLPPVATPQGR